MARNNTGRATTVDSLYRGRTPDPSQEPSDQENDQPAMESTEKQMGPPRSTLPLNVGLQRENKRMRLDRGETPSVLVQEILSQHPQQESEGTKRYYDPDQDPNLKRDLRIALRDSYRDLKGKSGLSRCWHC
jgi:hypothetical protein